MAFQQVGNLSEEEMGTKGTQMKQQVGWLWSRVRPAPAEPTRSGRSLELAALIGRPGALWLGKTRRQHSPWGSVCRGWGQGGVCFPAPVLTPQRPDRPLKPSVCPLH